MTPRHIGIVAVSAEGAALCYRTICVDGAALVGRHAHPEVSTHTFPLADYMRHIDAGRWDDVGAMLLASAAKLRQSGADLLICPDNTAHQGLNLVRHVSPLPWLHIAEEVAAVARDRGFRRLLVLGTRYLMEGPVYRSTLGPLGIETVVPDAADRARINAFIFDELVYGQLKESTRDVFAAIIDGGRQQQCEAVLLGCTEIPLLIDERHSPLPTLDSTRILARAALRESVREPAVTARAAADR